MVQYILRRLLVAVRMLLGAMSVVLFAMRVLSGDRLILACSLYGQLFRSDDGGDSWGKLRREFTEIRALAWTPN